MSTNQDIGQVGELLACTYLQKKGYEILERNWRFKHDEIDIIAQKDNTLIITEVKTRSNAYMGAPELAVTIGKQKKLIRAANAYILEKNCHLEVQFDVVGIILNSNKKEINHIKDAFSPLV